MLSGLLYRPDWQEGRRRLATWWNGGDIGRPAIAVTVPRETPLEEIPELPPPAGCLAPMYTTRSMEFRVNRALRACVSTEYLGEAAPSVSAGDLAPNCLALYLGCQGVEGYDTTWCEPFINDTDCDGFGYDPANFYWRFSLEAFRRVRPLAHGKFLQQFPDLIEGLDTLAAMRGTERLLTDLVERPDWVRTSLRRVTDLYFRYYDVLYDLLRDEVGGSVFWLWAPGRLTKLQCDFSAMISPAMFGEFMVPILCEMTERVSYSLYHWDGPGAIVHLDHLLSVPRLGMIQWTPGAGSEDTPHPRWWPLYHRILDAGKKLMVGADSTDDLLAYKREFGGRCKGICISTWATTRAEAEEMLRAMES
jgi:5-methyltetrahydrofolate--homocysteine methyltransferase